MQPSVQTSFFVPDAELDTSPIIHPLHELPPTRLELVSQTALEALWDELVRTYHYLGFEKLFGHRLKYLAFIQSRPVAALCWSAGVVHLRARDCFVGWSSEQRQTQLHRIANNSRFLIPPWVNIPHLASHVLALNLKRLNSDWEQRFGTRLWLVETCVDPKRFRGTCYRAANWKYLGPTRGFTKQGKRHIYHGSPKEVYAYVLEPAFRKMLGCESMPYHPGRNRPPIFLKKVEELEMILQQAQWVSNIIPPMNLGVNDLKRMAAELVNFHKLFNDCFGRVEHQRLGLGYFSGLLSPLPAKSVEPIALNFLQRSVRALQMFFKQGRWNHRRMEEKHQRLLLGAIGSPQGMLTVDACEIPKKGKESVGVARQYCGSLGKVDNCQSGVFVGYSGKKGYGLLTAQLYLPEVWFSKPYEDRRKATRVPDDLVFQTKPQIALNLVQQIVTRHTSLPQTQWLGCDSTFGSDWDFLSALPPNLFYFAGIRSHTQVFLGNPKTFIPAYSGTGRRPSRRKLRRKDSQPKTVAEIANSNNISWTSQVLAEGAKGPIHAQVARLQVYPSHEGLPRDTAVWLFLRRSSDGEIKYAFSNAPEDIPLEDMCHAATLRWGIEQCFQEGKGQLGMDHYEHRSWPAWHRHMIYVFLGLHFLLRVRLRFKKNSNAHLAPSQPIDGGRVAASLPE